MNVCPMHFHPKASNLAKQIKSLKASRNSKIPRAFSIKLFYLIYGKMAINYGISEIMSIFSQNLAVAINPYFMDP